MTEVLKSNFNEQLPNILLDVQSATFIAIDTEFSALFLDPVDKSSLSDTPAERYAKLRNTVIRTNPVQVGVSVFKFNPDENAYVARTYYAYTWPYTTDGGGSTPYIQISSFNFMRRYGFDFNKLFGDGVPYLNTQQLLDFDALTTNCPSRILPETDDNCIAENLDDELLSSIIEEAMLWYNTTANIDGGDDADSQESWPYLIRNLRTKVNNDLHIIFELQLHLRLKFAGHVTTYMSGDDLVLIRTSKCTEHAQQIVANSEEVLGFTRVFREICASGKPLIGHNMFMDLMLLINAFVDPLPQSYQEFKQLVHKHLPHIWDTRCMNAKLLRRQPRNAPKLKMNSLHDLYEHYYREPGDLTAIDWPNILMPNIGGAALTGMKHNAGWDSYCTGYVFIRMAYEMTMSSYTKGHQRGTPFGRTIMSGEMLKAIKDLENFVNLIRAQSSHIVINGDDPPSKRPPSIIIEHVDKRKTLNIAEMTAILRQYGFVEMKSLNAYRALIVIDNFHTSNSILAHFQHSTQFKIWQFTSRHQHVKYLKILGACTAAAIGAYAFYKMHIARC